MENPSKRLWSEMTCQDFAACNSADFSQRSADR
jgi:hypothetical protein